MITKNKLLNNENLIYNVRKSLFIFLVPIGLCGLLYVINKLLLILIIPMIIVYAFIYLSNYLLLTNKRVIGQSGILNVYTIDTLLKDVTSIIIEQNIWGRIFDFGNITLVFHNEKVVFRYMAKPNEFKRLFYELVA